MSYPALPLDHEADGTRVAFFTNSMATFAQVWDEDGVWIDSIREHTFREAYDRVRSEYPGASWRPGEDEV